MTAHWFARVILFTFSGLTLVATFQNCSPQFQVNDDTFASTGVNTTNLSLDCLLQDGSKLQPGAFLQGYPMMSALYPLTCGGQVVRTCLKTGQFDGPVPVYNSCNQMCTHPVNGQAVNSGSTYVYYSKAAGTSQADCDSARLTSTCQQGSGTYFPEIPAQRFASCSVLPQTCAYTSSAGTATPTGNMVGATVTGFLTQSATFPTLCGAQATRTCDGNGTWGGSVPLYTACAQSCVHPVNGQAVSSGSTYVYYSKSTGTSQADCDSARLTSTCQQATGAFAPAIPVQRFASCLVQAQTCAYTSSAGTATPTGNLVGSTVTGFLTQSATFPTLCGAQTTRTCAAGGSWGGSVPLYTACAQSCVHPVNGQAVSSGSTYVYYSKSTGISQADCDSARLTSTCQQATGAFAPVIPAQRFASCLIQAPIACSYPAATGAAVPTGTAVGSTVTGFGMQASTYPSLCGQQVTRTCGSNGAWSGAVPVYSACSQKCLHPDSSQPVDVNAAYIYYTLNQGTAAQCAAARVSSTCQNSGLFAPAPPVARYSACTEFPLPVVSSLTASPNAITSGQIVTLSWVTTNAVTLMLNPGVQNVTGRTNIMVSPAVNTTYTLTATNPAGSASRTVSVTVSVPPPPPPPPAGSSLLGLLPCAAGSGADYQVGPGAGQLASLDLVPWENLKAGDTVRIFYSANPYKGKFILSGQGTAQAPIRVCGVKGPNGERPIIDGNGATTRSTSQIGSTASQQKGLVLIKTLANQAASAIPRYVQIDGLVLKSAHPNYQFTNTAGAKQNYTEFGACVWIETGHNIVVADNEITDCNQAIFSTSTDGSENMLTRNIRIAGNKFTNNGVSGTALIHTTYIQSYGVIYEYNHFGALRSGAPGNSIKDRSVNVVIRYNRIEAGTRAMDLMDAEEHKNTAKADPLYRSTYVYGNQIKKSGREVIHYGGDHPGSETFFRKGTLYFFNNTVITTGNTYLFQITTTEETVEAWNNVIYSTSGQLYFRSDDSPAAGFTAGGILNLGVNWVSSSYRDSNGGIGGQFNGAGNLIVGTAAPVDLSSFMPVANSPIIDKASAGPAGASAHKVDRELNSSLLPALRTITGTSLDLGAVER